MKIWLVINYYLSVHYQYKHYLFSVYVLYNFRKNTLKNVLLYENIKMKINFAILNIVILFLIIHFINQYVEIMLIFETFYHFMYDVHLFL